LWPPTEKTSANFSQAALGAADLGESIMTSE
jgi:hypothetical protein